MATKKIYIGSFGPVLYEDDDLINDVDGDFVGEYHQGLVTDGDALIEGDEIVRGDLTVVGDVVAAGIDLTDIDGITDRIVCVGDTVVCLNNNVVTL